MSMHTTSSRSTYIVHIPARSDQLNEEELHSIIESQLEQFIPQNSTVEQNVREYLEQYPVVYIVHAEAVEKKGDSPETQYIVYVGETNDIVSRTRQHLIGDAKRRSDWQEFAARGDAQQYVIGNEFFNKSLTLDVENKLMHYMSSVESVSKINNRRTNAQGKYYTHEKFDAIFHDIWLGLHEQDPTLFPAEQIIRDSALFKASPFHELSADQKNAENMILDTLFAAMSHTGNADQKTQTPTLIFVGGAAGTGKTVLLSHLFYRIMTEGVQDEEIEENAEEPIPEVKRPDAFILVNHKEQENVYNQIATKLGLQKKDNQVVMRPSQFITRFSRHAEGAVERVIGANGKKHYIPEGKADIVLVDEAHLLHTQGNQAYSGSNMLADILRRAKVVVAIFDPGQILESRQRWSDEDMVRFFPKYAPSTEHRRLDVKFAEGEMSGLPIRYGRIQLHHQFRIAANDSTVHWLEQLTQHGIIGPFAKDEGKQNPRARERGEPKWVYEPYDLQVFDSPATLMRAIRDKAGLQEDSNRNKGLSRVLATYDWAYKGDGKNPDTQDFGGQWGVEMHREHGEWLMGASANHDRGMNANDDDYFFHPWNYQLADTEEEKAVERVSDLAWAEKPHTIDEIGSTFTIQGFDLNYAGVILGPSVTFNPKTQQVEFHPEASKSKKAIEKRGGKRSYAMENLQNEFNVLMTRGVHGLYIFAFDPALRAELKRQCKKGDCRY
ncbi:DUF2075 domain-containing protein [Bifidobacterium animalis]|nr:DUF2075 domain-containing protein [Bifidobacterium animalis]